LTFGDASVIRGALLLGALCLASALVGAGLAVLPDRWRRVVVLTLMWTFAAGLFQSVGEQLLRGLGLDGVEAFLYTRRGLTPVGALMVAGVAAVLAAVGPSRVEAAAERWQAAPPRRRTRLKLGGLVLFVAFLAILPDILGPSLSEVMNLIGITLMMALGLNIVVGYAGLLDLGYVAFFAVGAYAVGVLTSPSSPGLSPELNWWAALPFVFLAAALAGVIVGTPVLRMRGDYLAIVTLGFGEIARLLVLSDWLTPYFGGAQGIISIADIQVIAPDLSDLRVINLNGPQQLLFPIALLCLVAIYVSWALENSRFGRAWMAMREDEPVAEVVGIDIVTAKLSAFVVGAILASLGGAVSAAKVGAIFPGSFNILVSITVLAVIIVGGMGSIQGVVLGAFVLVGLPELLREFAEYRLLFYGAVLIVMMLKKPEGLLPSKRRAQELHQDAALQDAWLKKAGPSGGEPASPGTQPA
jgi:branched-chain amino acid transport system permease protein